MYCTANVLIVNNWHYGKRLLPIHKKIICKLSYVYDLTGIILCNIKTEVVDFSNAEEGAKILDVVTDTGKQAFTFAKRGYKVVDADLLDSLLKRHGIEVTAELSVIHRIFKIFKCIRR